MSATKSAAKRLARCLPAPVLSGLGHAAIWPLQKYLRYAPWALGKKLLWNKLVSDLLWLESTAEARTFFDCKILVDPRDLCGRYIYYFGIWEPNLTNWISSRLKDGDVFVDVGANVGYFSLLAATLVGRGHVVAVEPTPRAFNMLQESSRRSHAVNVRAVNVAAWHEPSVLKIFSGVNLGMSTLMSDWAAQGKHSECGDVPAARLSDVLTPEEIRSTRVVKIDVEGAEWHVIQGMAELFENCRDDLEVIVEVTPKLLAAEHHTADELLALFARRGYRPYLLENDYSPFVYCDRAVPRTPRPITNLPAGSEQADIIFSRQ